MNTEAQFVDNKIQLKYLMQLDKYSPKQTEAQYDIKFQLESIVSIIRI